jgi:hypothetical protein
MRSPLRRGAIQNPKYANRGCGQFLISDSCAAACCLLLTAYCLLPTAYCLLSGPNYSGSPGIQELTDF